jgi:hypothetical protein
VVKPEATDLNAVAVNQDGAVWHNDATLLAEQGQWYRFFHHALTILPTHAVEDTEPPTGPAPKSAQKKYR